MRCSRRAERGCTCGSCSTVGCRLRRRWAPGGAAAIESAGLTIGSGGAVSEQVELFPKQDRVAVGKFGNNIGLPFRSGAAALRHDLSLLGPDDVLPVWETTPESVVPRPATAGGAAATAKGYDTEGAEKKYSRLEAAQANAEYEIRHIPTTA